MTLLLHILLAFLCNYVVCLTHNLESITPSNLIIKDADITENVISVPTWHCNDTIILDEEYVILENGSLLLPENKRIYTPESYKIEKDTAFVCVTEQEAKQFEDSKSSEPEPEFSEEFRACGHILIETKDFRLIQNGSIYIEMYGLYYKPSEYYLLEDTGVYVCYPDFENLMVNSTNVTDVERVTEISKFSTAFAYVTLVGLLISIGGLIMHLIVFCCVSKVRNLPGCCLASLSLSLLLAYTCFLSGAIARGQDECARLGASVYYFFLTSFFWMNTIAFDVWRSFRVVVSKMRITSHRVPWRKFLVYSLYSWLIPAALVAFAEAADNTDILPIEFKPDFGKPNCWFGRRKALLVFFALPLCVIMLFNALFFLDSAYVINVATIKKSTINDLMLRKRFFMFMRLALLMGLTWIIGIIAGYVNHPILWYVFIILNTLQGLFIFIVFSCSSKVRTLLVKKLFHTAKTDQSTSVRTISQMSNAL